MLENIKTRKGVVGKILAWKNFIWFGIELCLSMHVARGSSFLLLINVKCHLLFFCLVLGKFCALLPVLDRFSFRKGEKNLPFCYTFQIIHKSKENSWSDSTRAGGKIKLLKYRISLVTIKCIRIYNFWSTPSVVWFLFLSISDITPLWSSVGRYLWTD